MSHVITQPCCNDAACVAACPVNCIHPTPDEPGFATAEMLYIDPATCIDCGACVADCPVDAIVPDAELIPAARVFLDINAAYYRDHDVRAGLVPFRPTPPPRVGERIRVAVVASAQDRRGCTPLLRYWPIRTSRWTSWTDCRRRWG